MHGMHHGVYQCHVRNFLTKEEKIEKEEEYKEWLDDESKGISETLK
jgi:hypothetical protein